MSIDAPCHCSWSGGQVEKNPETCLRLGRRCFSGRWQRPFIPQIVESSTSRGSRLSAQTTPSFPRAIPLGHISSAVGMSLVSSTKLFSTSCAMRERVISVFELALDQLFWHSCSSGSSSGFFAFGSQRLIGSKGEKAPEGMPSCSNCAME